MEKTHSTRYYYRGTVRRIIAKAPDFGGMADWFGCDRPPFVVNGILRARGAR